MKIRYDREVDAFDIVFKKGKVAKTKEIGKNILLDVDVKGTPLSLEILGASKKYKKVDLEEFSLQLPTAARIS